MSPSTPSSLTPADLHFNAVDLQRILALPPGNYTGDLDGRLGPQTRAAFTRFADATLQPAAPPAVPTPDVSVPPPTTVPASVTDLQHNDWPLEANAAAFFGYPPNLTQIETDYPMHLFSGNGQFVTRVTCNVKVAASLRRIFAAIHAHYGTPEALHLAEVDVFDGIYNDRPVRGQNSGHSMHAYGAAIDIDAEHNVLGATHGSMPPEVVAIFHAEGWRWGGNYQGRKDWMHFEACR